MHEELEVTSKVRQQSRGTDSPGEEAPAIHYPTKAFPFTLIRLHCAESTEKERVQPHLADGFARYGALPLYSQTSSSSEGKAQEGPPDGHDFITVSENKDASEKAVYQLMTVMKHVGGCSVAWTKNVLKTGDKEGLGSSHSDALRSRKCPECRGQVVPRRGHSCDPHPSEELNFPPAPSHAHSPACSKTGEVL